MKNCSGCGVLKDATEFPRCAAVRSGRSSRCKACMRGYYEQNKASIIERHKLRRSTDEGRKKERAWQKDRRRSAPAKRMLQEAKARAKRRGLAFDLKTSDIEFPLLCPVLGIPMTQGDGSRCDGSPSLDRIDGAKGYVRGNVMVISWRANRLKNDATPEELEAIVRYCRRSVAVAWHDGVRSKIKGTT